MHVCLFDIDGTLALTGGAGQTAFAHTLSRDFGIPEINRDVVFAGRSDRAIAMDLFEIHGIEQSPENWCRFCRGYVEMLEQTLPTHDGHVLPGVHELIAALLARGDVAVGLLTGNIREAARRKLSFYDLWHHFPFGGFGDEHEDRNAIAAAALAAADRHLGKNGDLDLCSLHPASSSHIVVIGDTLHDVRCGQSIGATCVAVATGHTTSDVLRTAGPDVVVETLEDVSPILSLFDR
jgi:phosphoglycolate phosphatase-like HAD superfamily hydrolase